MSTRFSIITVCYNARETLPGAVASLVAQTYPLREWVVVDGGSSDGTQGYVQTAGEPLGPFVSEKDRGIYDAMNKAVGMATGDVLYFLNADDALHDPQVLADVAKAFDADPDLDMLWGDVVYRSPTSQTAKSYHYITPLTIPYEDLCHQCIFARKRLFERVGGFKLEWKTSADYDWVLRVFRSGAKYAYMKRRMGHFTEGGSHAGDAQALARERRLLRLQYLSPPALSIGNFVSRAVHKLSKMTSGGYRYGEAKAD